MVFEFLVMMTDPTDYIENRLALGAVGGCVLADASFSFPTPSSMFKAAQHPQLRVGCRPCKGPRVYRKILKKI